MGFGYQIYCDLEGVDLVYRGITNKTIEHRWKTHLWQASKDTPEQYVHRVMRKYGVENFHVQKMYENPDYEECKKWEINTLAGMKKAGLKTWNLTSGGDGTLGRVFSDEVKQKISNSNKGRIPHNKGVPCDEETKRKIALKKTGSKHTPETIKKMCETRRKMAGANKPLVEQKLPKVRIVSAETRRKISEAKRGVPSKNKGRKLTDEQKKSLSIAMTGRVPHNKGKKMSAEFRQKISLAKKGKPARNKGVPMSPEQKEKLRLINLGRPSPNKGRRLTEEQKMEISEKRLDYYRKRRELIAQPTLERQ